MQNLLLDWLTFSLKPDPLAENKRDVDLPFIIDFLSLSGEFENFENVGGRNGYPTCWTYNNVSIMCPAPEHYERMGYCVMFTGDGLRWYASLFNSFSANDLMRRLVALPKTGLSLNISRLDIAMDDRPEDGKSGILDLDLIIHKSFQHEYVAQSRSKQVIKMNTSFKGDDICGRTIYFGSRKSSTYIRIYDKAIEQGVAGHWIRVEFEFKQESAMRVVNSIAHLGLDFAAYFPEVVNSYLRFIELDDSNRSRCSVSDFWVRFLGTCKRSKLSVTAYKRKNVSRLFQYMIDSYAPSLCVLFEVFPKDFLFDVFRRGGEHRLKKKHYDMIENPDIYDTPFSNSEKWAREVPDSVCGQLSLAS